MEREGLMTLRQAAREYDEFLTVNGHIRLKDSYLTIRRIGAEVTLNRAQRVSVYLSFENAMNHGEFQ